MNLLMYRAVWLKIAVLRRFKCLTYRNTLKALKRLYGQFMSFQGVFDCAVLPLCCADCMECACLVWSCADPVSLCPVFWSYGLAVCLSSVPFLVWRSDFPVCSEALSYCKATEPSQFTTVKCHSATYSEPLIIHRNPFCPTEILT